MFARNKYSLSVYASGIFGSKLSKTFRSVPSVSASFIAPAYAPVQ